MDIEKLYQAFKNSTGVTTDTRSIQQGQIFFALKGPSFNGNKFALKAIESGAALAVVDDEQLKDEVNCFFVPDVLQALQQLAQYHRVRLKAPVLAITGSNGKTTTKELIVEVLKRKYKTCFTKGNLNNHIGVPLTLLSIEADAEMAIVEMGANHIGEIAEYCEWANPDYGMITNIGNAHLEGFGSLEGVIKAKTELYKHIRSIEGKIFINTDNQLLLDNAEGIELIKYGSSTNDLVSGAIIPSDGYLTIKYVSDNKEYKVGTQLVGDYNFENVLAAVCIGKYFDVADADIVDVLESYSPSNNRSEIKECDGNTFILDAYNANPTSMVAAIENFNSKGYDRKIALLGAMKELGNFSEEEHKKIAELALSKGFEVVVFIGNEFKTVNHSEFFEDTNSLKEWFDEQQYKDCTFLVKGSRSIGLEKLLD